MMPEPTLRNHWLRQILQDSNVAPWLVKSASLLLPLIPEALKEIEKVVEEETQAPVVNANASNDTDKKEEVAPVDAKDENVADTGSTDDDTAKETEGGIDVSAEYEIAVENKIKVIRSKGWYNLFDTVEDGAKINESGLRAAAVEAAIEDYLKDED